MKSTNLKKTTDGTHQVDSYILFLYKKRGVANIFKSAICNELFPGV